MRVATVRAAARAAARIAARVAVAPRVTLSVFPVALAAAALRDPGGASASVRVAPTLSIQRVAIDAARVRWRRRLVRAVLPTSRAALGATARWSRAVVAVAAVVAAIPEAELLLLLLLLLLLPTLCLGQRVQAKQ